MKARIVRRFLWVAGFACLWLPVLDDPPLYTGAYLQDVTTSAATVAMITGGPTSLECVVSDAAGRQVATQRDDGQRRRHALRVTGLQPATEYAYRLLEAGQEVASGRLRTAPADDRAPVRFAFLGDSGGQPWWVWLQTSPAFHLPARWHWLPPASMVSRIGARVAAAAPDFVLHLGDIVYPRGWHAHYSTGFFRPFADVMAKAPLYAVLGNHDLMDDEGRQTLANLRLPSSDELGDGRCYSFAWGSLRVIALLCEPDLTGAYRDEHLAQQFLLRELDRHSEPWVIVASHLPIRSASRQKNNGPLMATLLPALAEHQVSLYLSGHDHCYQRFGPSERDGGMTLVVSGGGGKSLYETRPDPAAAVLQSQYHWCSAEIATDRLSVRAHGVDGGLIDSFSLALPTGAQLESVRRTNPARAARIEALRR